MITINPATLSRTHIFDGEEVVTGGDDGQAWVATFADPTTADLFMQWCRARGVHPGGLRINRASAETFSNHSAPGPASNVPYCEQCGVSHPVGIGHPVGQANG
jgi:hypothetical protein